MKVKFCGLKTHADIDFAAELGCYAVGFVLVPGSRREISIKQAMSLIQYAQSSGLIAVALLADADRDFVLQVIAHSQPDIIQFHGHESADFCQQFNYPYWKAIPMLATNNWLDYVCQYNQAQQLLLDAYGCGQSGGSGQVFKWFTLPVEYRQKLILAGGLTVANVAQAIKQTGAEFIDVSSGIEQTPGVKSPVLMQQFMQAIIKGNS
ncbi:MAG: phosphoribosylanthranilate isomerase [Proteobacteria bacterium]|nr:MAG: phosphoribosylanthranilate isomerase [Pseudomonadota bacterium]